MSDPRQQRRLAATLAADVVGYTRAMADDEAATLDALRAMLRGIVAPAIAEHEGRIFKEMGDGILAEFPSAVGAAQAAMAIQAALAASNAPLGLRIGLHVGDVIVEGDDLFGDGVNIAARLQAEAEPGGIAVSADFRRHAEGRAGLVFDDLGTRRLKGVAEPMAIHALGRHEGPATAMRRFSARWLGLAMAVVATLGLATFWAATQRGTGGGPAVSARASAVPTIAVLPFENLSPDAEQAYFADGLAGDLITDLSMIEGVRVISRTSSFAYRDRAVSLAAIAGELRVRYVIEGSVRRAGDRLRITASLVDTDIDTPLWAKRFEGSAADVFGFQDRITGEIMEALRVELTPAERRTVTGRGTHDPAAYDAYLHGLRLVAARRRLDAEANAAAQAAFEEAIRLDPGYALAYAGLAWTKWLYFESVNAYGSPEKAFALAEKSLTLEDNALAHLTLAKKYFSLSSESPVRDLERALAELKAANHLRPSDADILADLAIVRSLAGQPDEALRMIGRATELNPGHPGCYFAASGIASLLAGETARAVRHLEHWMTTEPNWEVPYVFYAAALALAGRRAQANAALARFECLSSSLPGDAAAARLNLEALAKTGSFTIHTTSYAVKRRWPMAPEQERIFLEGLRVAGMRDAPA